MAVCSDVIESSSPGVHGRRGSSMVTRGNSSPSSVRGLNWFFRLRPKASSRTTRSTTALFSLANRRRRSSSKTRRSVLVRVGSAFSGLLGTTFVRLATTSASTALPCLSALTLASPPVWHLPASPHFHPGSPSDWHLCNGTSVLLCVSVGCQESCHDRRED